jgi:hypothetical protein
MPARRVIALTILLLLLPATVCAAVTPRGCDFTMPGHGPIPARPWLQVRDEAGFVGTRYRFAIYAGDLWRYVPGNAAEQVSGKLDTTEARAFEHLLIERNVFRLVSIPQEKKDAALVCISAEIDGRQVLAKIRGDDPFAVMLRAEIDRIIQSGR